MHPDELLYGAFSRYHKRKGADSSKATFQELFGTQNVVASIDFPSHLDSFLERLPDCHFDSVNLIFTHTMLPLFYPFLDKERQTYAVDYMRGKNGKGIYMKLGVMASRLRVNRYLRYCPECLKQDLAMYGGVYWHRVHNVSGVFVCAEHKVFLREVCPECGIFIGVRERSSYASLGLNCENGHDLMASSDSQSESQMSTDDLTWNWRVAENVQYLLNTDLRNFDIAQVYQRYLILLKEKDFLTRGGSIRQRELHEGFLNYYGETFLHSLGLELYSVNHYSWLAELLHKHNEAHHPIKYILLINFLSSDIRKFFGNTLVKEEAKLFGYGPWLCLNPIADHHRRGVITDCSVSYDEKGKPVATYACTCGFIYSVGNANDLNSVDSKRIKIRKLGQLWEEKLRMVVQNEGGSLRSIARKMGADPNTIKKYTERLGIEPSWKSIVVSKGVVKSKEKKVERVAENYEYANDIKYFVFNSEREYTRTEVRALFKKEYAWLYRNNKELLESILPKPIKNQPRATNRVNWVHRDTEIFSRIKTEVNKIMFAKKAIRITKSLIGERLGISAIFEQHIDKLPMSKELLNMVIESVEDYQIRRINMVLGCFAERAETPKEWKIYRIAGIKRTCSTKVGDYIKTRCQF